MMVSSWSTSAASLPDACGPQRAAGVAQHSLGLVGGDLGEVGQLAGDAQHRRLRVVVAQLQLRGDRPGAMARRATVVAHLRASRATGGGHARRG
jgi:hypothetical protein